MKRILILFTGGTIASVKTQKGLEPILNAEQILSYLPEMDYDNSHLSANGGHTIRMLKSLSFQSIQLDSVQICNVDSTDMDASYWMKLVESLEANYRSYDGFVVCHGTDTMAYTAAALSYFIQNSQKPIVLTGSQQPIQMEITDAKKNLYDSIIYAADEESRGVCIIFDGKVIAGTRGKKTKSSSYHAFSSINFPELASMRHGKIVRYIMEEKPEKQVTFYHHLNTKIFALKLTPGMSPVLLESIFREYDGIILESFGVGGIPSSITEEFTRLMKEYEQSGKMIVLTTQVTYEGSNISTYEVGERMKGAFPFLESYDMNFEAVLTKCMWILGMEGLTYEERERLFYTKINYDVLI